MTKVRIIIIENDADPKVDYHFILEQEDDLEIRGEVRTLVDAFKIIKNSCPDIVILDALYKYTTGLELIRLFKKYSPETHYIVLTKYLEKKRIQELLEAGISAYVAKEDAAESLVPAIRSATEGKVYLSLAVQRSYPGPSDDPATS
jgi:DNA-binding NarL/FixJ family response regulator